MLRRVYLHLFGEWWSLTPAQWLGLILRCLNGDFEWDLDKIGRRLQRTPHHAVWTGTDDGINGRQRRYAASKKDGVVAAGILDWTPEDWQQAMQDLRKIARAVTQFSDLHRKHWIVSIPNGDVIGDAGIRRVTTYCRFDSAHSFWICEASPELLAFCDKHQVLGRENLRTALQDMGRERMNAK